MGKGEETKEMMDDKAPYPDKIVLNLMSQTKRRGTTNSKFKEKITKESFAKDIMRKLPVTINTKRGV